LNGNRLAVSFLGKAVSSPLVLPAGVMGVSFSGLLAAARNGAAVVTTKSYTLEPRPGHHGPVIAEVTSGLLNSMGLCNPGLSAGLREIAELREHCPVPVIISLFDTCPEGFARLAAMIPIGGGEVKTGGVGAVKTGGVASGDGAVKTGGVASGDGDYFIELNLSCPNVRDEFGSPLASSPDMVRSIVAAVKRVTTIPVIAKLSPNVTDICAVARAAEEGGADALSLINTVGPGMAIDVYAGKPVLGPVFGGLSGPCVKPIALRAVYEVTGKVGIPVIGMGGIADGRDLIEMRMAGATLVGVGTATAIRGLSVFEKIKAEAEELLDRLGRESIAEIGRM
jgi:dihydroorotate dehydrogenase (NAD+) catalytic subunit